MAITVAKSWPFFHMIQARPHSPVPRNFSMDKGIGTEEFILLSFSVGSPNG